MKNATSQVRDTGFHPKIEAVAILTCNRAELFLKTLQAHLKNRREFGRQYRLLVLDDGRDLVASLHLKRLITEASQRFQCPIQYIGIEEKRAAAGLISRAASVSEQLVALALMGNRNLGPTTGANRNCLLLAGAGGLILSIDDDVVPQIVAPPVHNPSKVVGATAADPTRYWAQTDCVGEHWGTRLLHLDHVALHEEVLGRVVNSAFVDQCNEGPLRSLFPLESVPVCPTNSEMEYTTVGLSFPGVWGDSGMYTALAALTCSSLETRAKLAASDAFCSALIESPELIRCSPSWAIARYSTCPGLCFGLDTRQVLPPFLPALRNQDGLFFYMAGRYMRELVAAHLPYAVHHCRPEKRSYRNLPDAAQEVRVSDLLIACLGAIHIDNGETAVKRWRTLGSYLCGIAKCPDSVLSAYLKSCIHNTVIYRTMVIRDSIIPQAPRGSLWRDTLEQYVARLEKMASSRREVQVCDIGASGEGSLTTIRWLFHNYGSILQVWPDIMISARELSQCDRLFSNTPAG